MEIVSKPDLRSPDEVSVYIKKLRSIMRYLGTCDGNMQEGSLRADVNVSVRKKGSKEFGTRCEIKNVNSIKFMQMAIEYEANRQVDLIEDGQSIDQETRLFDTKKNETRSMRSKEIRIERLHLEQDAGKRIHDMDPSNTYVDLNRSGIALMEIVSEPDLR